jgi:small-conductance mechanosensitive channel
VATLPIVSLFGHITSALENASLTELIAAPVIVLLSLLIGIRLKRFLEGHHRTSGFYTVLDIIGPLVSPILVFFFSMASLTAFRTAGTESDILTFLIKLSAAWFAITLIILMSSKRTAGWFVALVILPLSLLQLFGVWDDTIAALTSITFSIGSTKLNVFLICKGIIAILVLQWLASGASRLVDRRLSRLHDLRPSNRVLIMKIFQITLYCIIIMVGMQMLGISLAAFGVFGGALGVGIGLGLQKISSNFLSGIILLFEKSIEIGDLIELSDGTTGYVRQIYARYTRLEMQNGKEIFIPNEEFINQRVTSWTHMNKKARIDVTVSVGYDSDLKLARQLMIDATSVSGNKLDENPPACHITAFGDNGIDLQLFFWIKDITAGRADPKTEVMYAIFESFKRHGISIPFPQREVRILADTDNATKENA